MYFCSCRMWKCSVALTLVLSELLSLSLLPRLLADSSPYSKHQLPQALPLPKVTISEWTLSRRTQVRIPILTSLMMIRFPPAAHLPNPLRTSLTILSPAVRRLHRSSFNVRDAWTAKRRLADMSKCTKTLTIISYVFVDHLY